MNRQMHDLIDRRLSVLQIDKDKMQNIVLGTTQKRTGYKQWKMAALAACLVLVLSLTVIAAGLGYFDLFFEEKAALIRDDIAQVKKSVENNGIIFTVESAYTSESGGFITASFTKKDGGIFGSEPHDGGGIFYYNFIARRRITKLDETEISLGVNIPYSPELVLSDDKKTLSGMFVITRKAGGEGLNGKTVRLIVDYLQGPRSGARYDGPWEIDVTMPKTSNSTEYTINYTTEREVKGKLEAVTIESISFSPAGFCAQGTGNKDVFYSLLHRMEYKLKGESWFNTVMINNQSFDEIDGKTIFNAQFQAPIKTEDIECIYINGEEIQLG